jgi:hypothetical protein
MTGVNLHKNWCGSTLIVEVDALGVAHFWRNGELFEGVLQEQLNTTHCVDSAQLVPEDVARLIAVPERENSCTIFVP